jgi:hypothetical protein
MSLRPAGVAEGDSDRNGNDVRKGQGVLGRTLKVFSLLATCSLVLISFGPAAEGNDFAAGVDASNEASANPPVRPSVSSLAPRGSTDSPGGVSPQPGHVTSTFIEQPPTVSDLPPDISSNLRCISRRVSLPDRGGLLRIL